MTSFFRFTSASKRSFARKRGPTDLQVELKVESDKVFSYDGSLLHVEGGKHWPDIMEDVTSPAVCCSERVVSALDALCPNAFDAKALADIRVEGGKADKQTAPKYFQLEIKGSITLNLENSGLSNLVLEEETGRILVGNLLGGIFVVDESTWKGDPLCVSRSPLLPEHFLCTPEIIKLAGREKWTNARFYPSNQPGNRTQGDIDYLKWV
jgi:hypothetical protein